MKDPKLTPGQDATLRKRIERQMRAMGDDERAFFYEQPDALRAVFEGDLSGYFERMRRVVPPTDAANFLKDDAAGWKALQNGRVLMSVATRVVDVDYRPLRSEAMLSAGVFDDPDDTEDIDDLTEHRNIIRAGGMICRRLKRVWFDGDVSVSELEGLIRLKGWKKTDARTLLAWAAQRRSEIEPQETVAASAMPLLKRDGGRIRLTSGVTRMRDKSGPFIGFKRDDAGLDMRKGVFTNTHSFLVEIPDDRDV